MDRLTKFLADARDKCSYESGAPTRKLPNDTIVIGPYSHDDLSYTDTYNGLVEFKGFELIERNGVELWRRDYSGLVSRDDHVFAKRVYDFLKKAMRQFPRDKPFVRGPVFFTENDMKYVNIARGDMKSFTNQERIFTDDEEVYFYKDRGGLI